MILPDTAIRRAIANGYIGVEPQIRKQQIQPASLDVRLGAELVRAETGESVSLTRDGNLVVEPHTAYLGHTYDKISLPKDIAAQLTGRSSVGRQGVLIHKTAGWIDPGFEGQVTLEIYNLSNEAAIFDIGERIGQLVFFRLSAPSQGYDGKYQGQTGATESR